MKGSCIYATKWQDNTFIDLWFENDTEEMYMFSIRYNKGIYEYFRHKKSVALIMSTHKWNKNRVLDRLIHNRIPYELKVLKRKGVKI